MTSATPVILQDQIARPIVTADSHAYSFVQDRIAHLETKHGVRVEYDRNGERGRTIDRGNLTLYGAFDPNRSYATTIFGVTASKDNTVVGVLQMAVFNLGQYNLAQYMTRYGLYQGGPDVEFKEPAIFLATGIQGTAGFNGDLWVHPTLRGGSEFARDWTMNAAMINRVIAMATLGANGIFLFMRQAVYAKVQSRAERSCLGVAWGGEERAILYSGQAFIRERMLEMCPDLMSRR